MKVDPTLQTVAQQVESLGRIARSNAALSNTPDAWKEHAARLTDIYVDLGKLAELDKYRDHHENEARTLLADVLELLDLPGSVFAKDATALRDQVRDFITPIPIEDDDHG